MSTIIFDHTKASLSVDQSSQMDTNLDVKMNEPQSDNDPESKAANVSSSISPNESDSPDSLSLEMKPKFNHDDVLEDFDLSWLAPVKGGSEWKANISYDSISHTASDASSFDMGGSQTSTYSFQMSASSQELEPEADEEITKTASKRKFEETADAPALFQLKPEAGEKATKTANKREFEESADPPALFDPARLFGAFEPLMTNQPAPAFVKAPAPALQALPVQAKKDAAPKSTWVQPSRKAGKCHNCLQEGHWASECPFIKSKMLASRGSKCALCPFVIKPEKDVIVKLGCGPFTYQWVHRACGMEHMVHLGQF